jgi:hypothetical protein
MKKKYLQFCFVFLSVSAFCQKKNIEITLISNETNLTTNLIQEAIDRCASAGGGTVHLSEGVFLSKSLELKSNVTLHIGKGCILQGSMNIKDYKNDAFIFAKNISNVSIQGEGVIDGVDCFNAKGEEGFRGPHAIRLINCKNIRIEGITIKNAANWAINCRYCSKAEIKNISIRGGHDGLHTRFCDTFEVAGCDFRTGDDTFAGNDNRDFIVTNCKINSSCNGFRMGCYNLTVRDCKFWGPGEYIHKIQKRNNMLAAFVHFSPNDEKSKVTSGKWLIENVTVDQVDHFYMYNYRDGLWQTGKPISSIQFKNIKATDILSAFNIIGDTLKQFSLIVKNSTFSFRKGAVFKDVMFEGSNTGSSSFFYVKNFNKILLSNTTLNNSSSNSTLNYINGNSIILKNISFNLNKAESYNLKNVKSVTVQDSTVSLTHNVQ